MKNAIQLAAFGKHLAKIEKDNTMLISHVSLFVALFACWQKSGCKMPFSVTRKRLMAISKVASIATYHKCIRELNEHGYIRYNPSYNSLTGSLVYWPII